LPRKTATARCFAVVSVDHNAPARPQHARQQLGVGGEVDLDHGATPPLFVIRWDETTFADLIDLPGAVTMRDDARKCDLAHGARASSRWME